MNRLFSNGIGDKLLRNADQLKLDLWKADDGVVCNFELHGTVGAVDDDCDVVESADMQFVSDLLAEFRKGGTA